MGCITTVLALLAPRVVMVFLFLLADWFHRAYETTVWPVLGFFFMPYLTLAYMAAKLDAGSVSGWWLALVIVAAIIDVGHWSHSGRHSRARRQPPPE